MSYRKYSLVNLSREEMADQMRKDLAEFREKYNLKPGQAGYIDNIAIVPDGDFSPETYITVNKPSLREKRVDKIDQYKFPEELKEIVAHTITELNLRKDHLKVLSDEVESLSAIYKTIDKKVDSFRKSAYVLRLETDLDNFMNVFRSRYSRFFDLLIDSDLTTLDQEKIKEVCTLLEDICILAVDVREKLLKLLANK